MRGGITARSGLWRTSASIICCPCPTPEGWADHRRYITCPSSVFYDGGTPGQKNVQGRDVVSRIRPHALSRLEIGGSMPTMAALRPLFVPLRSGSGRSRGWFASRPGCSVHRAQRPWKAWAIDRSAVHALLPPRLRTGGGRHLPSAVREIAQARVRIRSRARARRMASGPARAIKGLTSPPACRRHGARTGAGYRRKNFTMIADRISRRFSSRRLFVASGSRAARRAVANVLGRPRLEEGRSAFAR